MNYLISKAPDNQYSKYRVGNDSICSVDFTHFEIIDLMGAIGAQFVVNMLRVGLSQSDSKAATEMLAALRKI